MGRVGLCALLLCIGLLACSHDETPNLSAFHGVKLGMGLRDVRERYDGAFDGGTWTTDIASSLTVLAWSPSPGAAATTRFEFHNGMLVAVRADLSPSDPLAAGPRISESKSSVVLRDQKDDRKTFTLIARDCPVHRPEVEAILAQRSK